MFNAWDLSDHTDGHFLPCHELHIQRVIDAAFKRKSAKEVNQLIEDIVKRNYRASSETSGSSSRLRGSGVIEMNKMPAIEAKLDALMNKLCMQERSNWSAYLVRTVEDQQKVLNDGGLAQDGPYQ